MDGIEIGTFTGKRPKQAALKAANRIYPDISLSERGFKKVHIFTGERKQIKILRAHSQDARQDLEAQCQESRKGDIGEFLKASLSASLKHRI